MGATIYSDFNHKHVYIYENKACYPYLIQCHVNYMGNQKIFNYMLEFDILGNAPENIGCPEGCFLRLWERKTPIHPAG